MWEDKIARIKKQAQNEQVKFEHGITNSHYNLFVSTFLFQVWLYELFPSVVENFANRVDVDAISRMLTWVPSKQPTFARVDEV